MKIFWLPAARQNLLDAIDYLAERDPSVALALIDEVEAQSARLQQHPFIGRSGRVAGTRELVINRTPYILVYRVRRVDKRIELLRLLHGAQQWPP